MTALTFWSDAPVRTDNITFDLLNHVAFVHEFGEIISRKETVHHDARVFDELFRQAKFLFILENMFNLLDVPHCPVLSCAFHFDFF